MVRNLLVTGGAGFIGLNYLIYHLKNYDDNVIVLDSLTYAASKDEVKSLDKLNPKINYKFYHGSINDTALVEDIFTKYHIDTVINFAAESHVDRSIQSSDPFINTNILGTHNLLKVCLKYFIDMGWNGHFHQISTDEVYGSLKIDDLPFLETTQYAPNSPYAASKQSADMLCRAFHKTYGLNVTISHCSNNYGPYQDIEKLIPKTIKSLLLGDNVTIYGDGRQIRDWIYVLDHIKGIELIVDKREPFNVYNLGANKEITNIDIINTIIKVFKELYQTNNLLFKDFLECPLTKGQALENLVIHVSDRPGHDRRYAIDFNKASKNLGYSPTFSFESAIKDTVLWYLKNYQWWKLRLNR